MTSDLSLWNFSCAIYAKPGVESACLNLQDNYEVDIPLLLFCCWAGLHYDEIPSTLLQQAVDFTRKWSLSSTYPLRNLRCDMKSDYQQQWPIPQKKWQQLRDQVKALELESERLLLGGLQSIVSDCPLSRYMSSYMSNHMNNHASSNNVVQSASYIKFCFPLLEEQLIRDGDPIGSLLLILAAVYPEHNDLSTVLKRAE